MGRSSAAASALLVVLAPLSAAAEPPRHERRVVWSVGRDLMMQPPQEDGPVNSLAKMYVEVDGKQFTDWTRELTYAEIH